MIDVENLNSEIFRYVIFNLNVTLFERSQNRPVYMHGDYDNYPQVLL